ncbi:uncharacterized protein LOC134763289 [Penaeus indicus]|uniref:uncharacterized protein LOC134763289 n=1 Tax=Penaeus indicus TaxID=29960 RepID=UPI00300C0D62
MLRPTTCYHMRLLHGQAPSQIPTAEDDRLPSTHLTPANRDSVGRRRIFLLQSLQTSFCNPGTEFMTTAARPICQLNSWSDNSRTNLPRYIKYQNFNIFTASTH